MERTARHASLVALAIAIASLAFACGGDTPLPTTLSVKQGDSTLGEWDADRMRAELQTHEVRVGSSTFEGPLLSDLLAASGAPNWATVVAHGKGPNLTRDVAPLIRREDADAKGYLIALISDGTFRLILPGTHDSQWVRRVTELTLSGE